jgi:protein TonB
MSIPTITYSAPKSVDVFTVAHPSAPAVAAVIDPTKLIAPGRIPTSIDRTPDEPAPNPGALFPGAIRAEGNGSGGDAIPGFIPGPGTTVAPRPEPRPATPQRIKVSDGVTTGMLIFRVQPVYPPLARMSRVQGAVQLHAVIGRDGTIQNLTTLSGHPMLVPAAVEAVRQWRYRPYLLNGEPVEVETQVTVNFTLGN